MVDPFPTRTSNAVTSTATQKKVTAKTETLERVTYLRGECRVKLCECVSGFIEVISIREAESCMALCGRVDRKVEEEDAGLRPVLEISLGSIGLLSLLWAVLERKPSANFPIQGGFCYIF